MPEIIAVRRNLTPGAVFFRQRGNIVEYSLDNTTWRVAFVLGTQRATVPPSVLTLVDNMTVNEFINFNNQQFINNITSTTLTEIVNNPASRIDKNICQASQLLAAAFVAAANEAKQSEHENHWRDWAAGMGLRTAAIGLLLVMAGPLGWVAIGAGVTKALSLIGAGLAVGAGASGWFETLRDDTPPMTDADVELIACYIYRNTKTGTVGKAGIQNALLVNWADLPPIDNDIAVAFAEMFDADPTLYSVWLSGLTDLDVVACECGGCDEIDPATSTIEGNTGYFLLSGGIRTIPRAPTAEKGLVFNFPIQSGQQVDTVTLNFVTTQYQKHSTIGWAGVRLAVRIFGMVSGTGYADKSKPVTELSPYLVDANTYAGGMQTLTFDFTDTTFNTGTSGTIRVTHMLTQGVAGVGADSVFTGGRVCYRGP